MVYYTPPVHRNNFSPNSHMKYFDGNYYLVLSVLVMFSEISEAIIDAFYLTIKNIALKQIFGL